MRRNELPWNYIFTITPDAADESAAGNNPSITYLGFWDPGPITENRWQIRRVTVQNNITITEYADGNEKFDKSWADRATYNYSLLR